VYTKLEGRVLGSHNGRCLTYGCPSSSSQILFATATSHIPKYPDPTCHSTKYIVLKSKSGDRRNWFYERHSAYIGWPILCPNCGYGMSPPSLERRGIRGTAIRRFDASGGLFRSCTYCEM